MKNSIVKYAFILFAICLVAAAALGVVNNMTLPVIAQINQKNADDARKQVLPEADQFEKKESDDPAIVELYEAKAGGQTVGFAILTQPNGYAGSIDVLTGIQSDGTVSGISISNMNETPGLGAKASEPEFKDQYVNKPADGTFKVVKNPPAAENEIQSIAGSTITSDAVTAGINQAAEYFNQKLK